MSISNLKSPNNNSLYCNALTCNSISCENMPQRYVQLTTSSSTSMPSGSTVVTSWSTVQTGDNTLVNVSEPSSVTIVNSGIYIVCFTIQLNADSNTDGTVRTLTNKGGAMSQVPQNGSNPLYTLTTITNYSANDSLELIVTSNNTTSRTILAGNSTQCTLVKIA